MTARCGALAWFRVLDWILRLEKRWEDKGVRRPVLGEWGEKVTVAWVGVTEAFLETPEPRKSH